MDSEEDEGEDENKKWPATCKNCEKVLAEEKGSRTDCVDTLEVVGFCGVLG